MFGDTGAGAGRGLALRMDHGTQYTADDFLNQVKFWGIAPSFAFVAEPQTHGVAERFNRTLKEKVFHGRIFKNLAEVRIAVAEFKERYNCHWRLEKWTSCHPLKSARLMPCERPPELQKRVQTIGAGTLQGQQNGAWLPEVPSLRHSEKPFAPALGDRDSDGLLSTATGLSPSQRLAGGCQSGPARGCRTLLIQNIYARSQACSALRVKAPSLTFLNHHSVEPNLYYPFSKTMQSPSLGITSGRVKALPV